MGNFQVICRNNTIEEFEKNAAELYKIGIRSCAKKFVTLDMFIEDKKFIKRNTPSYFIYDKRNNNFIVISVEDLIEIKNDEITIEEFTKDSKYMKFVEKLLFLQNNYTNKTFKDWRKKYG